MQPYPIKCDNSPASPTSVMQGPRSATGVAFAGSCGVGVICRAEAMAAISSSSSSSATNETAVPFL